MTGPRTVAVAAFLLVLAAYANHFQNGFHFDDDHTIVNNTYVRDAANIPRFFVDADPSSVLPSNRSYRPILFATLALDYRIAGGYRPMAFQIDTFAWFLIQLATMWWLFARIAERCGGDPMFAIVPTAVYALHPACAETVNYIIQRGDVISTCGVVVALAMYAYGPRARARWLSLVPLAIGILAKPPAMIFPALLAAYVVLIERRTLRDAAVEALPSLGVVSVLAWWSARHTPATFTTGGGPPGWYWLTQTFVAARYFLAFFAPIDLSADNDWPLLTTLADVRVALGLAFFVALVWTVRRAATRDRLRPVAFGLVWFALALVPTSIVPLAEVANDHRMFFPFVGLSLAVCWTVLPYLRRANRALVTAVVVALLAGEAVGVHARNAVWRTDDSLWYDVTQKSPRNGRGLMNYGLARMEAGDIATATTYFERALALTPSYPLLHINLAIAYAAARRDVDADREFNTAIRLAPNDWRGHYYYGRWLRSTYRLAEARAELERAVADNPADAAAAAELAALGQTPVHSAESELARSLAAYRAGRFDECLEAARAALAIRPTYAEAYNNIAAAYIAMGRWDEGIAAAEEALRLDPALTIARNNLNYARQRKPQSR